MSTKATAMSRSDSRFVSLTKPGIIFGNVITLCGGFFLASHNSFDFSLFVSVLLGMALVIACGCVLNNCIDRDIDRLMKRTQNRVMARGLMSTKVALLYGATLGILGFLILYFQTNKLTVVTAFVGLFFYVVVYSVLLKRRSIYGVIIGGIAGAVPPVAGYCAVTNRFDMGAVILFLILFTWQIPHFYAISIFRKEDFRAAKIPVLPVVRSMKYTKVSMLLYTLAFAVAAVMPAVLGYAGVAYFVVALLVGLTWLVYAVKGFKTEDDRAWARKMFSTSIIGIMLISFMMLT